MGCGNGLRLSDIGRGELVQCGDAEEPHDGNHLAFQNFHSSFISPFFQDLPGEIWPAGKMGLM